MTVKLNDLIAPSFFQLHLDIKNNKYTHYWIKGGRGSTKSSFVSLQIILGIMKDKHANAVAIRKFSNQLRESVFEQLIWAIDVLNVSAYWSIKRSKLELIYNPTGQRILFKGADEPKKLKSLKISNGYIRFVWYEEVDELQGEEEIRNINQSLLRGGDTFTVFYTYNPPKSVRSWVNSVRKDREDVVFHHSTYLSVPRAWTGEQFAIEAEYLMRTNETRYKHEYLGLVTGTGGAVFANITIRKIKDKEIESFEKINRGLDWGFAQDPLAYVVNYYDSKHKKLYIFFEYYKVGTKFDKLAEVIKTENTLNKRVIADSSEPRSNAEMRDRGIRIYKAKKGKDSREHGCTWLQNLSEIIIDDERCPNTAREFLNYEFEKDANGQWKDGFPDKDDHTIDATRYALEHYIRSDKFKLKGGKNGTADRRELKKIHSVQTEKQ